jgi:hypothetical protein
VAARSRRKGERGLPRTRVRNLILRKDNRTGLPDKSIKYLRTRMHVAHSGGQRGAALSSEGTGTGNWKGEKVLY